MPIASAQQSGGHVKVYDEKGHTIFVQGGVLLGFTGRTVTVQKQGRSYTYDDKGRAIFVR